MIKPFKIFDEKAAPKQSRSMLKRTKANFGMIPNLECVMVGAPALLFSYVKKLDCFPGLRSHRYGKTGGDK